MFKKILVANRGEIACRIIRTARRLDIRTVAVYSEQDKDALHVEMADEAVCIGPAPAAKSYLSVENILDAMKRTGADAVHPGYGFLSERAAFAAAVADAGAIFIGPSPEAIHAMGDKIESKKLAAKAGVCTVPGFLGVIRSGDEAVEVARKVGYPVMIKAAAGGGGKGMRVARNDNEVIEGFARASSEAKSSFSDERVFIEKYIEQPRHIEIQILADAHGNCVYLWERECSIQRRHQKVIEEAPSPFIDPETRRKMGEQAVALAQAVGYQSAGTVEFIVDQDRNFYFLEMNTRLQVEHPVTELITGLDLVEEMFHVAAGRPLTFQQKDIKLEGWAIESRIYAEDPFNGYLPSTGRLLRFILPHQDDGVRVDTGVMEGREISMFYDPMIAKLCTWAPTRAVAIERMRRALDEFYISGVSHNVSFLSAIMSHPRFQEGRLSTRFIEDEYPGGFKPTQVSHNDPHLLTAIAGTIHVRVEERNRQISGQLPGTSKAVGHNWIVLVDDEQHAARVLPTDTGYTVVVHGDRYEVATDWSVDGPLVSATVNGLPICAQVERDGLGYRLFHSGASAHALVLAPRAAELYALMPVKRAPDLSRFLLSPMPGLLLSLHVTEGEEVQPGQMLAIVEAMKMENVLRAKLSGVVAKILASPGESLSLGKPILEFAE